MIHDFATLPKTQSTHQAPEPISDTRFKSAALFAGGMSLVFSIAFGFFGGDDQNNDQTATVYADSAEFSAGQAVAVAETLVVEPANAALSKTKISQDIQSDPVASKAPLASSNSAAAEQIKSNTGSTVQTILVPVQKPEQAEGAKPSNVAAKTNVAAKNSDALNSDTPTSDSSKAKQPAKKSETGAVASIRASAKKEEAPEWGFYEKLKTPTWPIPVATGAYVDGDLAMRDRPIYELQAASFKNGDDASKLVGKLAKKGLKGQVNLSVSSSGQEWYRVLIGPFNHTTNLNKAQDILVSMNMMPLKRRVN